MAITDVVVPQLSESVSEATLLTWKKQPGQAVQADEILIEVETDKVVLEVPAPASGVLSEIVKTDGSLVTSGEVLARIDTEGKAAAAPAAAAPAATPAATAPAAAPAPAAVSGAIASPAASKILADKGVSAASVAGTGRDGRIDCPRCTCCENCALGKPKCSHDTVAGWSARAARAHEPVACACRRAFAAIAARQRDFDDLQRSQYARRD